MNRIEQQKQWLREDTAYWLSARKHKNYNAKDHNIRALMTLCGPKKPIVTERTLLALEERHRRRYTIKFQPGLEDFRDLTPLGFLGLPGVGMRCLIFFGALMQLEGYWKEYDLTSLHYRVNNGLRSPWVR